MGARVEAGLQTFTSEMQQGSVWVKLPELPVEFFRRDILLQMGRKLGKCFGLNFQSSPWNFFAGIYYFKWEESWANWLKMITTPSKEKVRDMIIFVFLWTLNVNLFKVCGWGKFFNK